MENEEFISELNENFSEYNLDEYDDYPEFDSIEYTTDW